MMHRLGLAEPGKSGSHGTRGGGGTEERRRRRRREGGKGGRDREEEEEGGGQEDDGKRANEDEGQPMRRTTREPRLCDEANECIQVICAPFSTRGKVQ